MNIELFDGAACAASDLTARLAAELARANRQLADAEHEFGVAAAKACAEGHDVPFRVRSLRVAARRQIDLLRHVLAGMPYTGDCHVESA